MPFYVLFLKENVHWYIKIQLFPVQVVGLTPLMRCQVISFTCHYILSRLLNPLMQSAVVCVSIYMPLFHQRVSADCTHCTSWQVLLSFQNWAPSSHKMLPAKPRIFQPQKSGETDHGEEKSMKLVLISMFTEINLLRGH